MMCNKIVLILIAICSLILFSCRVNDCGCNSTSPLNGRWNGGYYIEGFSLEITVNLTEINTNVSGSGVFSILRGSDYKDIPITLVGSFVSNRLTFKLIEVDSIYFDGLLDSTGSRITGKLLYKDTLLPYIFTRISKILY